MSFGFVVAVETVCGFTMENLWRDGDDCDDGGVVFLCNVVWRSCGFEVTIRVLKRQVIFCGLTEDCFGSCFGVNVVPWGNGDLRCFVLTWGCL